MVRRGYKVNAVTRSFPAPYVAPGRRPDPEDDGPRRAGT